ncbi:MRC1-like domain-containing protein [Xylariomycetidae sp. FL0641]|nr:MRC1-like domain-containing protein [Xylariomycetidae sp. FL0641]
MSSTRASSPAGDVSASTSPQLTPRSKVKAMLAAIDNEESDDETTGTLDTAALFASIDKNKKTIAESVATRIPNATEEDEDEDEDDDEEEEEIVRPRGRIAARMHANYTNDANKTADSPKSARERSTQPSEHVDREMEDAGDNDEEAEKSSALPRRLARPARESSPDVAPDADAPSSPGLFVSPSKSTTSKQSAAGSDTEDDLPADLSKSSRFKALVERKRKERLEKEAEEQRKREERAQRMAAVADVDGDDDDVSDISDDDGGRKLTQDKSRPARKASKKALEEMNRETQRISRSLQLAHEAKTKKKLSKASLFERFNFKTAKSPPKPKQASSSRPTTPGSVHQTDAEMADAGTPPSSPPAALKTISNPPAMSVTENDPAATLDEDENGELPDLEAALSQKPKLDKGKGKEIEIVDAPTEAKKEAPKPRRQVRVKMPPVRANLVTIDSDDDLEVTGARKGKLDAIFDRVPEKKEQEPKSMHILRHLAHLGSPPKKSRGGRNAKPSMTTGELQMSLQQRAREQAKLERDRRLEYLRSKGVVVQSTEEREREREQVEDIVARARQEVEEIMARERDDAKKARKEKKKSGEEDPLAWDDSDDDSFEDSDVGEPEELEISGSEEDDDDEADGENGSEEEPAVNPMVAEEAEEDDEGEKAEEARTPRAEVDHASDEDDDLPTVKPRPRKIRAQVVSDDEDDDEVKATPKPKTNPFAPRSPSAPGSGSPKAPTSVLRSARKNFIPGLPVPAAAPAGLGLTQIFAGTMDDSQAGPGNGSPGGFMPSLDQFPDSQFSATAGKSQNDEMVFDSQPANETDTQGRDTQTQGIQLEFSQSSVHGFDSLMRENATQMSEFLEPTQDAGFQDYSPLKQRFVEPPQSTVDTVVLGENQDETNVQDSPLVRKTGKLRRRVMTSASVPSLPPPESPAPAATNDAAVTGDESSVTAFKLMQKAARRKERLQKKFDRKKSKATEMIEEQAEESEDEYAGLGGADGEDSSEDDEEFVKEMIDDAAGNDIDEAKLAGFFADRERAADAAQVDKLFHDITTGMLRKRRRGGGGGNDFDLSDSDDGGEARRRRKRRQFAKMQKALFADERIGKIAENPRNAAFLRSIEDRGDSEDDDDIMIDSFVEPEPESQDQGQEAGGEGEEAIPDSQPLAQTVGGRKRSRLDDQAATARPPPAARRTKDARPTSLAAVRRELSSLLDDTHHPEASNDSVIPATELGSDDEAADDADKENQQRAKPAPAAVVDRISLQRSGSSNGLSSMTTSTTTGRLAFEAGPGAAAFKVPALLRRATTNSLVSNSSGSSAGSGHGSVGGAAGGAEGKLKKTAGRRANVASFARETERQAKVRDAERRREEKKVRSAEGRGKVVGGLFRGGSFE